MADDLHTRRTFLTASGGILVAAATLGYPLPAGAAREPELSPLVLSGDLYASPEPQRFAFAIARGSRYDSTKPAKVALAAPDVTEGTVYATTLHTAGLAKGRGVYVSEPVLDVPGTWQALAITRGKKVPFAVRVKKQPEAPTVGSAASRASAPTKADPLGVKPICTRTPRCPLHKVSLSEVVGTGRPVAVLFATPALCQSQYCGPVLDELLDVRRPYEDRVAFVHVEIYRSNRGADLAPTVEAWGLPTEPWFFTIDGAGTITGRLDGAFGGDEMTAQLDTLVPA